MPSCSLQDLGRTNGDYSIPMYRYCTSWTSGSPIALKLSLTVAEDCSVVIRPIGDKTCADFGAASAANKLTPLTGTYNYNYNDLKIQAYYTAPGKIRTLLPSNATGSTRWARAMPWQSFYSCGVCGGCCPGDHARRAVPCLRVSHLPHASQTCPCSAPECSPLTAPCSYATAPQPHSQRSSLCCSSFMLNIIPSTNNQGSGLTLQMYPATTKPADSAITNVSCNRVLGKSWGNGTCLMSQAARRLNNQGLDTATTPANPWFAVCQHHLRDRSRH